MYFAIFPLKNPLTIKKHVADREPKFAEGWSERCHLCTAPCENGIFYRTFVHQQYKQLRPSNSDLPWQAVECSQQAEIQKFSNLDKYKPLADLRGQRGTRAPLWPKLSSFSCSFRKKICQIIGLRPPPHPSGVGAPPLGNPGSATENNGKYGHFCFA